MTKLNDRRLFRVKSRTAEDHVVLNWLGKPIEHFSRYAEAYHSAGRKLAEDYGSTGALRDFESAPVVFLYRHSFELYLKAVVLAGSKIVELQGGEGMAPDRALAGHRLGEFVPQIKKIIAAVGWSWDMGVEGLRTETDFVQLVKELEAVDPGSFAFRYPTDKKGEAALPERFEFSVSAFANRLDPLLESLAGAVIGLEEYWDAAAEAAYEAQQDAEDWI